MVVEGMLFECDVILDIVVFVEDCLVVEVEIFIECNVVLFIGI